MKNQIKISMKRNTIKFPFHYYVTKENEKEKLKKFTV